MEWQVIVIRLALSMAAGMLIGMERERHHRPAGIKTHMLVCMGAALVSLMQVHMNIDAIAMVAGNPDLASVLKSDSGRLGAQVISGIGFLGAGTIIRNQGNVRGLTTAATIWLVGCVGLAIGMGYYLMSILAVIFVLFVLTTLKLTQRFIRSRVGEKVLEIKFSNKKDTMEQLSQYFARRTVDIRQVEMIDTIIADDETDKTVYECQYTIALPRAVTLQTIITEISTDFNVFGVREFV